jgi:acetyl esterase/lipase
MLNKFFLKKFSPYINKKHILYNVLFFLFRFNSQGQFESHPCKGRYEFPVCQQWSESILTYGGNLNKDSVWQNLRMRIFQPSSDSALQRPVIIFVHGGSFTSGSLNDPGPIDYCKHFVKRGYVTASLEYRLGINPSSNPLIFISNWLYAVYRAAQDGRSAVRYFRAKADSMKIDPQQIYLGGFSAGGGLAIHAAYLDSTEIGYVDKAFWGDLESGSGNGGYPSQPNGIFSVGAGTTDTLLIEEPIPAFLFHGFQDPIVPFGTGTDPATGFPIHGSGSLARRMTNQNIPHTLKPWLGPIHIPAIGSQADDSLKQLLNIWTANKVINTDSLNLILENDTLKAPQAWKYQWFKNDTALALGNNFLFPENQGIYKVKLLQKNGCWQWSSSIAIPQDSIVVSYFGLGKNSVFLQKYGNFIRLIQASELGNSDLKIFDLNGKEISDIKYIIPGFWPYPKIGNHIFFIRLKDKPSILQKMLNID